MGTKASIAPQKDTKGRQEQPSRYFLIDAEARKGFGHMVGMLWLRDIETKKVQVAQ